MTLKIAIADTNEIYAKRLAAALEKQEGDRIRVSSYSEQSALTAVLSKNPKRYDIVIFAPGAYDTYERVGDGCLAVLLYDEDEGADSSYDDFPKIDKYQRAGSIFKRVLELYADVVGRSVEDIYGRSVSEIITVYSPAGGTGKTTMALAIAKRLAAEGHSVIYADLEDIASDAVYLPQTMSRGLSELAAALEGNVNIPMKIEGLRQSLCENLYYLGDFDSPNDVNELNDEDAVRLVEALKDSAQYRYVIVDLGTAVGPRTLALFDAAQYIAIIERADAMCVHKLTTLYSLAHVTGVYGSKMGRLQNCYMGSNTNIATDIPLVGTIPFVEDAEDREIITHLAMDDSMEPVVWWLTR